MLNKFTKNVATIGPATESEEIIGKLIDAGMNVARFNTKHSSPKWHQERIARVRKISIEKNASVGILLDLQGPEIRIDLPEEKAFELIEGETCVFTNNRELAGEKIVWIPENVVETLQVGNLVLLDDGFCELEVVEKEADFLTLKALGPCEIKHRKTMNIPGVTVDMPSLVEMDYKQLDGAAEKDMIDFVGLSFVRNRADIDFLRQELEKRKIVAQVVAKIETQEALDNLEEIIEATDVVMVARGDLGVEVPYEELSYWQKTIITSCRIAGKPVITATQMLKSMTDQPRPTRAEVSDVANSIYDGTDAVMLSEETAIGSFPVKAVKTQAKIAVFNEELAQDELYLPISDDRQEVLASSIYQMVENTNLALDAVLVLTNTGRSAYLLSRLHPNIPVVAATANEDTYYQMSIAYGVLPVKLAKVTNDVSEVIARLKDEGIFEAGQNLVVMHGTTMDSKKTDTILLTKVK